jgi:hypothetical protein
MLPVCPAEHLLPAEPDRGVHGLERALDRTEQVSLHSGRVHRVLQACREGRDRQLGIVPGPVEPAVHRVLDPRRNGGAGQRNRAL